MGVYGQAEIFIFIFAGENAGRFTPEGRVLSSPSLYSAARTRRYTRGAIHFLMDQNPPFPSPDELKSKLSEFMKTNFGDKVSFATFTQPDTTEASSEEKPPKRESDQFAFDFLPR